MKIAIVCDNYKVDFFETNLRKAGFNDFAVHPGVTETTKTIKVEVTQDRLAGLANHIKVMNKAAQNLKNHKN